MGWCSDKELPFIFFSLFSGGATIFGTIGLVFYTMPYLGIIFVPLGVLYSACTAFMMLVLLKEPYNSHLVPVLPVCLAV